MRRRRLHRELTAAIAALTLASCGQDPSPRDAAYQRWETACPDHPRDMMGADRIAGRARRGDIEAIDCMILYYRAGEAPASARERFSERLIAGREFDSTRGAFDIPLLAHLYMRWRLTGEERKAVEVQARAMSRADIETAFYFWSFEPRLRPERDTDPCGRIAETDPLFTFVALGRGEREPASCPPSSPG